ncbi:hypothetical protein ACS0TY_018008 [Phlomoides rotata]
MMMVEGDEGSPRMEVGDNDNFGADDIWAMLDLTSPQDSSLDNLWFTDALTGLQNSEEVRWIDDTPESGVVSSQHILALESTGASSNGFVESILSPSIANSEMTKTPLFHLHEFFQAEDGITGVDVVPPPHGSVEASESSKGRSDVSSGPAWGSSFSYGEMPEPSSQISQGNGLFNKPADDSSQNASSYENDSKKAAFETPYHRELFNFNGANHVIHNQQSSDKNGRNKVPFETPNYGDTSCFLGFNHAIHKQDSSDFIYQNHEDYPVGITEYNPVPATGTESKEPSNTFLNEYGNVQGHSKVKKNIDLNTFSDISRASKVVDGAIYGVPSASEDETKDGILESRRAPPSLSMAGGTTIRNSFVAAHDPHSVLHVSEHPKMETEESEFKDSSLSEIDNPGVQNNTFEQGKTEDDSDLCILEDLSAPARSNRVTTKVKLVTAKQNSTSSHPGTQKVTTHAKRRPNNERVIFRVALQDLSQPKLEATLPDGVLSVPLLKHQRIALNWMANKETRGACCSGGILADDQGLGKTISTIALILKERPPSSRAPKNNEKHSETETLNLDDDIDDGVSGSYPVTEGADPCQINGYSVNNGKIPLQAKGRPSGGTLIVCPTSVLRQWSDELHNKVTREADLSVLVYYGGNRTKDPLELAKYDVVVTTYAIVSMEVPKQPVVNDNDDHIGSSYKDSSSCGKRKIIGTVSDRKSSMSKKSRKGIDNEIPENVSGPLAQVGWFRVVLDEAQSIKNHRTQAARACWGLRAKRRWCLSGTPIQNAVDDLYSYFRFLRHEPYAVFRTFCEQLKVPIHRNPRNGYKKLQAVLKTIMLRRTKGTRIDGEPIINLPPKIIQLRKIEFSKEERDFYSRLEADSRAQFAEYAAAGTVKQNYINILLMLLRLRQACDHPLLVKGFNSNAKMASSIEMIKNLPPEKQSFFLNCLEASLAICGICNDPPEDAVVTECGHVFCNQCICERITGDDTQCPMNKCKTHLTKSCVFSVSTLRIALSDQLSIENTANAANSGVAEVSEPHTLRCPQDSAKIRTALDLLLSLSKSRDNIEGSYDSENESSDTNRNSVKSVGEKAIVFSQWTGMLDLLESGLKSCSIEYRRLDGTMPVAARDKAVKDFNSLPEVCVIIMSLKAASLGLNMVAACNVLLLDLWWNPTTEDQAIDRAHRIGQTRPVSVFRLTVKDTVEDRILALQQKKRKMVAYAFGEDESGSRQSRLTVEDLKYLFRAG